MATPEFILELRKKVGHDLLWLTGITGIVLDDDERVLLVRRTDTGRWSLPAGILEPGEQPALGLLREIEEETAVESEIVRLVSIEALPPSSYPNGDQVQFLDLCFRCLADPGRGARERRRVPGGRLVLPRRPPRTHRSRTQLPRQRMQGRRTTAVRSLTEIERAAPYRVPRRAQGRLVRGFVPGAADADGDVQGDGHLDGGAHVAADQFLQCLALARGDLEDQFVVHLQEHPRLEAGGAQ